MRGGGQFEVFIEAIPITGFELTDVEEAAEEALFCC